MTDTIDIQFDRIISPRIASLNQKATAPIADRIKDEMLINTSNGRGFGSDPYDNSYSKSHKRRRVKEGLSVSSVNLRFKKKTLESVRVSPTSAGSNIEFATKTFTKHGEHILKLHHTGEARGGKIRSIFPKKIESIPTQVKNIAQREGYEVLSGKK